MKDIDSQIKRNIEDIYDLLRDVETAPVAASNKPKQVIFYGAPGTGKSYFIKNSIDKSCGVIRTTFHPDSDYSTFVGAYKPTTVEEEVMTVIGTKAVPVENKDGSIRKESRIVYSFVNQAFLDSYIEAWKKLSQAESWDAVQEQYLIIEEINRGNCAQIFGDIFQLLDRNDSGFSEYPIKTDADMERQLKSAFNNIHVNLKKSIDALYPKDESIVDKILNGNVLVLPNNLYIWATMNTSDQSLFPIDSAFKRRWDWKYMPIYNANKGYIIKVGSEVFDWWNFITEINKRIYKVTYSEDKKIGYFFCKTNDGIISSEVFVEKIIFYLWNEVFKDLQDSGDSLMADMSFDSFFIADETGNISINEEQVRIFLNRIGLEPINEQEATEKEEESLKDSDSHKTIIKVNGETVDYLTLLPLTTIKKYIELNPTITSEEIISFWEPFKRYSSRTWLICDDNSYNSKTTQEQFRSVSINCTDGRKIWVNKNGWMHDPKGRDTISEFIEAVNKANIGITITETLK